MNPSRPFRSLQKNWGMALVATLLVMSLLNSARGAYVDLLAKWETHRWQAAAEARAGELISVSDAALWLEETGFFLWPERSSGTVSYLRSTSTGNLTICGYREFGGILAYGQKRRWIEIAFRFDAAKIFNSVTSTVMAYSPHRHS